MTFHEFLRRVSNLHQNVFVSLPVAEIVVKLAQG